MRHINQVESPVLSNCVVWVYQPASELTYKQLNSRDYTDKQSLNTIAMCCAAVLSLLFVYAAVSISAIIIRLSM
jgi:hypothetical protein